MALKGLLQLERLLGKAKSPEALMAAGMAPAAIQKPPRPTVPVLEGISLPALLRKAVPVLVLYPAQEPPPARKPERQGPRLGLLQAVAPLAGLQPGELQPALLPGPPQVRWPDQRPVRLALRQGQRRESCWSRSSS